MSDACQDTIENGVDIDGKHYSYTLQDQSNISNALTLSKETNMNVPYHADGEACSLYSYSEICAIYIYEQMNLTKQQTYFNQLKLYIQSLTDITEKETIEEISYGIELTGEYLESYNEIIEQSNNIMTALMSV